MIFMVFPECDEEKRNEDRERIIRYLDSEISEIDKMVASIKNK